MNYQFFLSVVSLFLLPINLAYSSNLVVVGGALESSNAAVYQAFIDRVPTGKSIAIVPVASGRPSYYAEKFSQDLQHYGVDKHRIVVLHVATKDDSSTLGIDESSWSRGAYSPTEIAKLSNAGGIWFVGGDQTRIIKTFKSAAGTDSPMLLRIRQILAQGGVVGGTSAGAAIMSDVMIAAGDSFTGLTSGYTQDYEGSEQQEQGKILLTHGLGLFPYGIVDQHFDRKSRLGRLARVVVENTKSFRQGFGIDENTAMLVDLEQSTVEVAGRGSVTLLDAKASVRIGSDQAFGVRDLVVSVIAPGDQYSLTAGVSVAEGKALTNNNEAFSGSRLNGGGMGLPNARLEHLLAYELLDNKSVSQLDRFTLRNNGEGFVFRFRQTNQSRGYWGYLDGTKDSYSIVDVALDIIPANFEINLHSTAALKE